MKSAGRHARIYTPPVFLLLVSLLLPAGCASFFDPGPAPLRLQLSVPMPERAAVQKKDKQIVVALPQAGRELDSDGIALVFHGREIRYLAGARWTNVSPNIVQRGIIDALEASEAFRGVSDEMGGFAADLRLTTDLRAFSLEYADEDSAPVAHVAANFRVLDLRTGKVLGRKNIDATVAAAGRDNAALARAMEQALG
ncbi:ABC-type transport auxiliary lipoprotein family protein, partial [Desulfovibrio sp. OttesenSCG-928-A18]|nr:ABC-type transport auxiliary lipoprotein family protein [Desulfovibrio sp. OttesenSCG-928-A18]